MCSVIFGVVPLHAVAVAGVQRSFSLISQFTRYWLGPVTSPLRDCSLTTVQQLQ